MRFLTPPKRTIERAGLAFALALALAYSSFATSDRWFDYETLWTDVPAERLAEIGDSGADAWMPASLGRVTRQRWPWFEFHFSKTGWYDAPLPDGSTMRFVSMRRTDVMAPELRQAMLDGGFDIATYSGVSEDGRHTIALDLGGPLGFHAAIRGPETGTVFIDPVTRDKTAFTFVSYAKANAPNAGRLLPCLVQDELPLKPSAEKGFPSTGSILRTYRLAVSATGEYTAYHGGASQAMASIVTAVNRVNQIFERDLSVRFILVSDNMDLIFTDAATDPFTNGDPDAMLLENQTAVDAAIGPNGYDVGHVFGTNSGGVAWLGSVCEPSFKARGVSAAFEPNGDPFWVDYVAHEIGHQFGANHTFNSPLGSCMANRNGSAAYEPGSGSTIMSYSGLCSSDNLQFNSDSYFHTHSLQEMLAFLTNPQGAGECFGTVLSGNGSAPVVDAGPDVTIPANTPFWLTAPPAIDGEDTALTYCWEQYDRSVAATLNDVRTDRGPLFRSFPPEISPDRFIPRMDDLLEGMTSPGERLPVTTRTLTFHLTVRDNHPGGGRVGVDERILSVVESPGFRLLAPNGGEALAGAAEVLWDPAGTDRSPVTAATVDLLLSTNGGVSYETLVSSGLPNTGRAVVRLPDVEAAQARLMIRGGGNIFFDISDGAFSVAPATNGAAFFRTRKDALDDSAYNGNGHAEPGEVVALRLGIENQGNLAAVAVTGRLETLTAGTEILSAEATFPPLEIGAAGTNDEPFLLRIASDFVCGDTVEMQLVVESDAGTSTLPLSLSTGVSTNTALLEEGFEPPSAVDGFTTMVMAGEDRWAVRTASASPAAPHSGTALLRYEPRLAEIADVRLVTPAVTGAERIRFYHTYDIEAGWDGAVLELSVDGGSTWFDAEPYFVSGGYNFRLNAPPSPTLPGGSSNPLAGRRAWTAGDIGPMEEVLLDVSEWASESLQVGFRWGSDDSGVSLGGWFIDDLRIERTASRCEAPLRPAGVTGVQLH
ncbi:MAG: M12 family metallo-peptidase [Sumerlaeia bacterium]